MREFCTSYCQTAAKILPGLTPCSPLHWKAVLAGGNGCAIQLDSPVSTTVNLERLDMTIFLVSGIKGERHCQKEEMEQTCLKMKHGWDRGHLIHPYGVVTQKKMDFIGKQFMTTADLQGESLKHIL